MTEWRIYSRTKDDWLAGSMALGGLAVFTGLQIAGLTEWTFGDQEVVIVFWISVGLTLAAGRFPSGTDAGHLSATEALPADVADRHPGASQ